MDVWPLLGAAVLVASTVACGGQERGGAKKDNINCSPTTVAGDLLVDDFEDGDLVLASVGPLHGAWYVNNDGTGVQAPDPSDARATPSLIALDAGGHALHTSGTGFSRWGAFAAARLNSAGSQVCSVDLSRHSRLQLQVKGEGSFRVNVGTNGTTPVDDGGDCATDACSDYGASVQLTSEWRELSLAFEDLAQPEWADVAAFEPGNTLRLSFWAEGSDFDFWVDDIRFLP